MRNPQYEDLHYYRPCLPSNQERIYFDLRTKREKELREKVYLEIKKDNGLERSDFEAHSLESISLKQAAKNAFDLAIP